MRKSAIAMMAMLVMLVAVPAQAESPEVLELNLIHIRGDLEHEIVVFWNITRDDLCGWVEGGFVGPGRSRHCSRCSFRKRGTGRWWPTSGPNA